MGEYREDGTTMYVSRGIGMEGKGMPRMRFLCEPEIELIELRGTPGAESAPREKAPTPDAPVTRLSRRTIRLIKRLRPIITPRERR
jgi:hypothetical protein